MDMFKEWYKKTFKTQAEKPKENKNTEQILSVILAISVLLIFAFVVSRPVDFSGEITLNGNFLYEKPPQSLIGSQVSTQPLAMYSVSNGTITGYAAPAEINPAKANISITTINIEGTFKAPLLAFWGFARQGANR